MLPANFRVGHSIQSPYETRQTVHLLGCQSRPHPQHHAPGKPRSFSLAARPHLHSTPAMSLAGRPAFSPQRWVQVMGRYTAALATSPYTVYVASIHRARRSLGKRRDGHSASSAYVRPSDDGRRRHARTERAGQARLRPVTRVLNVSRASLISLATVRFPTS